MQPSRKLTIAFDINGTLTVPLVRQLFQALDRSRCHVIVWSTLGPAYCRRFCAKEQLEPDEIIDKGSRQVDIAVDDYPGSITESLLVLGIVDQSNS